MMSRAASVVSVASVVSLLAVGAAAAGTERYQVDPVHSTVIFRIKHLNVSYFYGRFNDLSGEFSFDDADAGRNHIAITVKAASIDTNSDERDQALKSAEFFNIGEHATISFRSTKVEKTGDGKYKAEGELTLLGVSRPLTVELERVGTATHPRFGTRTGFETTFVIKRSDFGMSEMLSALGDEVRLTVSIEGVLQKDGE